MGAGLRPAQGSASWSGSIFSREGKATSVSGLLGSRHFPEALNPASAPQNSPKVSGGTEGVGQINWKCHQDWTQGSLPWNQDTGLSFRTSALAATSPWTVSGPLAFLPDGQLGAWQGEDSLPDSRRGWLSWVWEGVQGMRALG